MDDELIPLYFLPSVSYMKFLMGREEVCLSLGERYHKQTPRNRCCIAGPNNVQILSIPVQHPGNRASLSEVSLNYQEPWNIKHWRSIETAYRKAPFFEFYVHHFEPLFQKRFGLLAELNLEALHVCLKILRSETRIVLNTFPSPTLENEFTVPGKPYFQVFAERNGFKEDLSVLDLIFNEGPETRSYLRQA